MSVYSNAEIRHAITQGHIVCQPLIQENIRGSSLDLTLGQWYFDCDNIGSKAIYNPFDENAVADYFGQAKRALPASGSFTSDLLRGVPDKHPRIYVQGGARILAHTHEFVGIHPPGTTEMRARSSWGRNGIAVCLCAGWGDPGYINRWTMEIHNLNRETIVLPIGERIAQLIFHQTGAVDGSYGEDGKYQSSTNIDEIIESWTPEAMLPRSYNDRRVMPAGLEMVS